LYQDVGKGVHRSRCYGAHEHQRYHGQHCLEDIHTLLQILYYYCGRFSIFCQVIIEPSLLSTLFTIDPYFRMMMEYMRIIFRLFVPRKEQSVAGEITAITGAGSGLGRELALQVMTLFSCKA